MGIFFLFFTAFISTANEAVRVRLSSLELENGQREVFISGVIQRIQGQEKQTLPVALPQSQKINLKFDGQHWLISGFKSAPLQILNKNLIVEGENLFIDGRKAPPKMILFGNRKSIDLVAVMNIENYLIGVLAHEMPANWPLETLKAQAIAARSYTLATQRDRPTKNFHLEASVLDQVYAYLSDTELSQRYGKILSAVRETAGLVLINKKQKILKAFYHADCGGETAAASEVWKSNQEMISVKDSFCPQNPKAKWSLALNSEKLDQLLDNLQTTDQVASLQLIHQSGQRVSQVAVHWKKAGVKVMTAEDFRQAIGSFDFRSTRFDVRKQGQVWQFDGRGFGHGVGLCQWGSRHLGKEGWTAERILKHYYPLSQLGREQSKIL